MGLFSSREDKIKKLDEELSNFDTELIYKKALKSIYDGAQSTTDAQFDEFVVLHHDLQEIKEELKKMNQK
ncbi:MAG TPA: hypothetical protein H9720_00840 [Candidatus Limosilactobacillus intestinigallinarum]|nr:hypothetical protein [Candidatus Limosilactobacillus intestinigallinarum]